MQTHRGMKPGLPNWQRIIILGSVRAGAVDRNQLQKTSLAISSRIFEQSLVSVVLLGNRFCLDNTFQALPEVTRRPPLISDYGVEKT